jgi:hypothetical protein
VESKGGHRAAAVGAPEKHCSESWHLSHPRKTCHSRHFCPKRMILLVKLMSGSSKKPDIGPTFRTKNPTFGGRLAGKRTWLLTILTILRIASVATRRVQTRPRFSQSSQYSELPAPPLSTTKLAHSVFKLDC